uniref:SGTA homodimerisation domain-containing protein n=1 Tax=Rhodosorus marinus TaxID=101924 RepID=A0A7S3ACC8_9RHOD|mmetsp:Transcript_8922/g.39449  ORF Transcript_8922/g.39449 Transcript_8922/m.39449 type:complete len:114 (+) Transcript_8922:349-690(+)
MDQKLVYSILEFLENGAKSGENIEVASQCLADAYQLDLKNAEQRAQLSVQPHSLQEVFEAGLASLTAGSKAEQPAAPKSSSTNEAYDAAFSKFLSSLKKTKFFDGVVEGKYIC